MNSLVCSGNANTPTNSKTNGGGSCKNCIITNKKGVEKIAQQLKQYVIKSLTDKINKNKQSTSKKSSK